MQCCIRMISADVPDGHVVVYSGIAGYPQSHPVFRREKLVCPPPQWRPYRVRKTVHPKRGCGGIGGRTGYKRGVPRWNFFTPNSTSVWQQLLRPPPCGFPRANCEARPRDSHVGLKESPFQSVLNTPQSKASGAGLRCLRGTALTLGCTAADLGTMDANDSRHPLLTSQKCHKHLEQGGSINWAVHAPA